jgi:hypothetical protein
VEGRRRGASGFAAQGQLVVTEHESPKQNGALRIWQVSDGGLRSSIPLAAKRRASADAWTLGADEQSIVTWSGRTARLWSLGTGEALFTEPFDHPPRRKATEWMPTGDVAGAAAVPIVRIS